MSNIGLPRGTVVLRPHDHRWRELFLTEADSIRAALKLPEAKVEHVGSTSIAGILAKPIIDMALYVDDLSIAEEWAGSLANIGYWYKGAQPESPDRKFFAKGPDQSRTVYLHVANAAEFARLVRFRDTLNASATLAAEYSRLKQELASEHASDRATYTALKNDFIQSVLER